MQAVKLLAVLLPCYLLILAMGIYLELQRQQIAITRFNQSLEYQFREQFALEHKVVATVKEELERQLTDQTNHLLRLSALTPLLQSAGNVQAIMLLDSARQTQLLYQASATSALPANLSFDWLPQQLQRHLLAGANYPFLELKGGEHGELLRIRYFPLAQSSLAMVVVQDTGSYTRTFTAQLPPAYRLQLTLDNFGIVIKPFDEQRYALYNFADVLRTEDSLPFSRQQINTAGEHYLADRSGLYLIHHIQGNSPDFGPTRLTAVYHINWLSLLEQWPGRSLYLGYLPLLLLLLLLLLATLRYRGAHAGAQLRAWRQMQERAFDGLADGCMIIDSQLRILRVNRAARELWQLSNPHFEQRSAKSLFGPSELWLTLFRKARLGDRSPTETCIPQADGSIRELQIQVSGLFLGRRKFDGMVLCLQDVTEQKRRQQQLQISSTAFHTHEMVAVTDAEANIIDINASFCKETGFSREELIGRSLFSLFSKNHSEDYQRFVKRTLALHGYWEGEVFTQRKHGLHLCELRTITAIFDSQGNLGNYVSTGNNISQRRHHEQQVES